jgi:hypothetical protein
LPGERFYYNGTLYEVGTDATNCGTSADSGRGPAECTSNHYRIVQ